MEEKLKAILESIGLNKNEIIVYIDLIKSKKSSALDISKRTKIHRSNTYDAIRKLIERGFIAEIIEDKKRLFSAIGPEKIKDYIKQQEHEVDSIMPFLKDIGKEQDAQEGISIIRGTFAVRECLKDMLKLNKDINVYGAPKEASEILGPGFLKEFHGERIKKKIIMRHIYDKNAFERIKTLNKMKYTEAKYIPREFFSLASTNICGDTVTLIMFTSQIHAIIIKNKEIANTYQEYFDFLWKQAKMI